MIHWLYITIQSRAVRQYSNEDVHNRGFCSDDEQYGLHNSFFSTCLGSPSAFESHVTFSKCDKLDLFSISLLEYINKYWYNQIWVVPYLHPNPIRQDYLSACKNRSHGLILNSQNQF